MSDTNKDTILTTTSKFTNNLPIPIDTSSIAKTLQIVVHLLKEDTVKYVHGILSKNPFDADTRETVVRILMEAWSSQDDIHMVVDGVKVYDMLFEFLDSNNPQQQLDTPTNNTPPITIPSTNTKI